MEVRSDVKTFMRLVVAISLTAAVVISCDVYEGLKAARRARETIQTEFGVATTINVSRHKPNATTSIESVIVRFPATPKPNRRIDEKRVRAIVKEAFPAAGRIELVGVTNPTDQRRLQ